MHDESLTARCGGRLELAQALRDSRADTLATFAAFERHLPGLQVPLAAEVNPPLWELGHIGWFQQYWVGRNPALSKGHHADPALRDDVHPDDRLYDSSRVEHDSRWQLPLPDAVQTRAALAAQLAQTLALLDATAEDDDALYFFRLALHHEDMHHEAALYTAQSLGVPLADPRWQPPRLPAPPHALSLPRRRFTQGSAAGAGFVFDNECGAHEVELAPFEIDAQVLRWADYLPWVQAGALPTPRILRRTDGGRWLCRRWGEWQPLDLDEPACHLGWHEASAWCRHAGRRLPTEAEWEAAALTLGPDFRWGDVWEWTASAFAPYPGFRPHPYRDYSAPWFDGRPVLRGASFMTQPRLRHPRYRNYFPADRSDLPAGLRSCAA